MNTQFMERLIDARNELDAAWDLYQANGSRYFPEILTRFEQAARALEDLRTMIIAYHNLDTLIGTEVNSSNLIRGSAGDDDLKQPLKFNEFPAQACALPTTACVSTSRILIATTYVPNNRKTAYGDTCCRVRNPLKQ